MANSAFPLTGFGSNLINVQTFSASGTYTPTIGMYYCIIESWGGGGGGAGVATPGAASIAAGGGGAGSYSMAYANYATIGASQTVTIGAAGNGGAAGNNPGTNGGDSSVGSICIGKGGSGASTTAFTGGAGGIAGTGNIVTATGQAGGISIYTGNTSVGGYSGFGGSTSVGGGGVAVGTQGGAIAGNAGTGFGSGGSGAVSFSGSGSAAGGNGRPGFVRIYEYTASGVVSITTAANASQAEMEAGTLNTVFTTPGRQQFHPSAAKAWVKFNGTAGAVISASYNVSGVVRNTTGDYTISFTVPFSSINYSVSCSVADTGGSRLILPFGSNVAGTWTFVAPTTGAVRVTTTSFAGSFSDSSLICVTAFGDQ